MKIMANIPRTVRRRGQALTEMAFCVLLFVVLTLGIIDFGRMLMVLNVITYAARDGARAAAVVPAATWATARSDLQARVEAQIATVTDTAFTVTPDCVVSNGTPNVFVRIVGSEPFIFPGFWGESVSVDRVATFRYEPKSDACP